MDRKPTVREELAQLRQGGAQGMIDYLRGQAPHVSLPGGPEGDLSREHIKDPGHLEAVSRQFHAMLDFFTRTKDEIGGKERIDGAVRYFLEGRENTYDSDAGFYQKLAIQLQDQLPPDNKRMLDLGCGNAALKLKLWDELVGNEGASSLGIDGSPTFALRGSSDTKNMAVGAIDAETQQLREQVGTVLNDQFGVVFANLVLDRVADPMQLIKNMHAFLAPGGTAVLGCLLPNTGEDDEDLLDPAQKLVYTPRENRITDGEHANLDAQKIRRLIESQFGVKVQVTRQPYHWKSSGGEGVYDKHFVFTWTKPIDKTK